MSTVKADHYQSYSVIVLMRGPGDQHIACPPLNQDYFVIHQSTDPQNVSPGVCLPAWVCPPIRVTHVEYTAVHPRLSSLVCTVMHLQVCPLVRQYLLE